MPRTRRIQFPGMVAHVFSRGNEKKNIYRNDSDRTQFIKYIKEAKSQFDFSIHAYCLMPNHYHFVLESHDGALGNTMQSINGRYSQYFNWKHKRTGHLFQGRYKSIVTDKDSYMLPLIRYVLVNPLKADLVERLSDYRWCSYGEYMGRAGKRLTETDWVLKWFSDDVSKARMYLKQFIAEDERVEAKMVEESMVKDLVFGSKNFVESIKGKVNTIEYQFPDICFRVDKKKPDHIINIVAEAFEVSNSELMKKRGKWNYARRLAIYFVNKHTGCNCSETAKIFDLHYSRVKRICESIKSECNNNSDLKRKFITIESSL